MKRNRIYLVLLIIIISLSFAACDKPKTLQQRFDDHEQFIEFTDAEGNTNYAIWYGIDLYPYEPVIKCSQNGHEKYCDYDYQAEGSYFSGDPRSIALNSYIIIDLDDLDLVEGEVLIKVLLPTTYSHYRTIETYTVYYKPTIKK